jgi:hypothetical protein
MLLIYKIRCIFAPEFMNNGQEMKKIMFCVAACTMMLACKNSPSTKVLDGEGMERDTTVLANDSLENAKPVALEEGEATNEEEGLKPYEFDIIDIDEMPETAERKDAYFQWAVYVNVESKPTEDEPVGTYTVFLADERSGTAARILRTNPTAQAPWDEMGNSAIPVPIHLVATAEKAWLAPGDITKIIVEGCPDGRNVWTYIIDCNTNTAKMFPTTEGVVDLDWEHRRITLATYGYFEGGGRYSQKKAFNNDGIFLRNVGKPNAE